MSMPLSWTVSHDDRLVHASAHGTLGVEDFGHFIADMRDAGLRPYAKLLDMRYAAVELRSTDIRALAQVHATGADPAVVRGPTAIVIDTQSAHDLTVLYDQRSQGTNRALAIFTDRERAIEWLEATVRDTAQASLPRSS
jgi:hypothetical protein